MTEPKLALVIDKSVAFLSFQKERILESWAADPTATKKVERVSQAGGGTLFGGGVTSLVEFTEADQLRQAVEELEAAEANGSLSQRIGEGLLITATVPRTSTKKAEALIDRLGGTVITTAADKKDKTTVAERLLRELNLSREARGFLLSYVGDDYEAVLPLVKTLSQLTPEQQARVTEEDLYVRMPQPPGAVAPWEIEKPLMAGDLTTTVDVFRRVSQHSHFLVVLKILNNKFQASYRVAALLEQHPRMGDSELAAVTGVNPRTMWLHKNNQKRLGLERLQRIVEILAHTEMQVKGGSAANGAALMESTLVRMSEILRR